MLRNVTYTTETAVQARSKQSRPSLHSSQVILMCCVQYTQPQIGIVQRSLPHLYMNAYLLLL